MKKGLVIAAMLLMATLAPAQETAASGARGSDRLARMKADYRDWHDRQGWSLCSSYSSVDFEDPAFRTVFDQEQFPLVRFGYGWFPVPWAGLDFSMGGIYEQGKAVGQISGKASGEDTTLYVVPLQWDLRLRWLAKEDQLIVPSVWAGLDWWYFKEANQGADDVEGDKTGWHAGVDLAFLLDPLDPDAAHFMKKDFGISSTYFTVGYEWNGVGQNETGLDFSGQMLTVGLRFEIAGKGKQAVGK